MNTRNSGLLVLNSTFLISKPLLQLSLQFTATSNAYFYTYYRYSLGIPSPGKSLPATPGPLPIPLSSHNILGQVESSHSSHGFPDLLTYLIS